MEFFIHFTALELVNTEHVNVFTRLTDMHLPRYISLFDNLPKRLDILAKVTQFQRFYFQNESQCS